MYIVVFLGAIVLVLFMYMKAANKKYNLPPGPAGLPFIGVLSKMDPTGPHKSFTEWATVYGDIFRVKLMGKDCVVLNSYDVIHHVLVKQSADFAGRPSFFRFNFLHGFNDNLLMSDSERWKAMKKLTMQSLKMYGDNLKTLEGITIQLTQEMLDNFHAYTISGESVDPKPMYNYLTSSIVLSIIFGRKLDDKRLKDFLEQQEHAQEVFGTDPSGFAIDLWPFLRYFPFHKRFEEVKKFKTEFHHMFNQELETTKKLYVSGEPKCLLDALLDYQNQVTKNKPDLGLTDEDLISIQIDLVNAGTLTTSYTLNTLTAVLVNNPEVQMKMRDQIKSAIGNRPPCLADKSSLPYIEATILETLRYHSQLPNNLPHTPLIDTKINGYDVPKGTWMYFNLWKIHHDEEFWDAPWDFRPERFLDDNGQIVSADHPNKKHVIAFGAGRRVCVGEVLAKNRLFLIVTMLLQNFHFLPESDETRPLHHPKDFNHGSMLYPKAYKLRLERVE